MTDAREWVDRQRINTLGVCSFFVFFFVCVDFTLGMIGLLFVLLLLMTQQQQKRSIAAEKTGSSCGSEQMN